MDAVVTVFYLKVFRGTKPLYRNITARGIKVAFMVVLNIYAV